ncbi:uncharacterized protein SCHCODRAFT_02621393 [Schizophyllum commune H4-8]|uniref:Expressed protein n=1 Tax=Schizophyllum commune (strain H4-8 / FGSC 9210) TaxID=578458 RepID=D8PNY4_SCHCM|nr:uncharacterized protein SCHCODRAFT_02621393 [Schizophyllum commune H4-8]KAI5893299.1 hypothetical protein SCHCODRAFT_02621393 [Schizophyllum commune H4-8]
MTVRFANWRLAFFVTILCFSATVLGITAYFASIFLPNLHHDFTIFGIVVSTLTILAFLIILQWAQPRIEVPVLFVLGVLWLALASWATDSIGNTQCDGLAGQVTATKNGSMSAAAYCREMRVVQAFSWMNFCLFVIAFFIILSLISQAQRFGRPDIWAAPIRELGWFGEYPGYYNYGNGVHNPAAQGMPPAGYPQYPYPYMPGYPQMQQPSPGTAIVIQPGINGAPPTITQVPASTV